MNDENVSKVLFKDPGAKPLIGLILKSQYQGFIRVRTASQILDIPNTDVKAIVATKEPFRGDAA